jgi:uncharacterized protein YciI
MAMFALICDDKPGGLDLRNDVRPKHREYLASREDVIYFAGPSYDAEGNMNGSLFLLEFHDEAGVRAFAEADPFSQAGLFSKIEIRPVTRSFGQWG